MGDALTGLASVIGAIGTIVTVYLAYKIQVVARNTDGTLTEVKSDLRVMTQKRDDLQGEADSAP